MIPKILHFIWVGDESKRPDNCIESWISRNPGYEIKIWGNDSLQEHQWINGKHMEEMSHRELNGVADMMRWEILYREGGIVLDADSICIKALTNNLLDCEAFACWENEIARPGLIAAGYFGSGAKNPFIYQIIMDIHNEPTVIHDQAWVTVGPQRLTDSYRRYQYWGLRVLPSHYFIPEHYSGLVYNGRGPVYANQLWGSTKKSYDEIHLQAFSKDGKAVASQAPAAKPDEARNTSAAPPVASATPAVQRSVFESRHEPYFVQRVNVSTDVMGLNRVDVFKKLCQGQRVLHIGCADWPITNPQNSLHLILESVCAKLDGFDIHQEALAALKPHTKGELFSNFEDITGDYDLVLVPEVMEHVPDIGGFLAQLHTLNATSFVMSVPDAYQCHARHFDYLKESQVFVEVVHPDHNCWYTPYTFSNVIKKYTPWNIEGMWFFNSISLLMLANKQAAA